VAFPEKYIFKITWSFCRNVAILKSQHVTYAFLAETYVLIFWSKKINFFDGGYRVEGGMGWLLLLDHIQLPQSLI